MGSRRGDARCSGGDELSTGHTVLHGADSEKVKVRTFMPYAGAVNLLRLHARPNVPTVDFADPPSLRGVMRGILGAALALAGPALVVVSIGARHIEWPLVTLVLTLWAAWSFYDGLYSTVVEPLSRFVTNAFTGGAMPDGTRITIDQETAMLERLLNADPPPLPHRVLLAGIRLAEIYRTHQHDTERPRRSSAAC